eukprot:766953-Hanusia_phi.AAC.1
MQYIKFNFPPTLYVSGHHHSGISRLPSVACGLSHTESQSRSEPGKQGANLLVVFLLATTNWDDHSLQTGGTEHQLSKTKSPPPSSSWSSSSPSSSYNVLICMVDTCGGRTSPASSEWVITRAPSSLVLSPHDVAHTNSEL